MRNASSQNYPRSNQRMMPDYHLVAGNLIEHEGKYALVEEGKEHVRGQWNLPAGGIEENEEAKEAAKREAMEETSLRIKPEGLAGVFFDESDYLDESVIVIVFYSEIKEEKPEIIAQEDEEILDTDFLSKEEIKEKELRTPFIIDSIENLETGKIASMDTIKDYR